MADIGVTNLKIKCADAIGYLAVYRLVITSQGLGNLFLELRLLEAILYPVTRQPAHCIVLNLLFIK